MSRLLVAAFYAFTPLDDDQREALLSALPTQASHGAVLGSVLVAKEGVNGTISGPEKGVEGLLEHLHQQLMLGEQHFERLEVKRSWAERSVFRRFKARRKKEIVTMGVSGIDPNKIVGTYVEARDWNELISDPEILLLDTRNKYEVEIGSFAGAVNPGTDSFREFPDYVKKQLDPGKHKKVAMFCTGGIRCEKASSLMLLEGFETVYHLKGGILAYLEKVPQAKLKAIDENELHNSSSIQDENTLSRGLDPVISNKKAHTAENEKELTSTKSRTID